MIKSESIVRNFINSQYNCFQSTVPAPQMLADLEEWLGNQWEGVAFLSKKEYSTFENELQTIVATSYHRFRHHLEEKTVTIYTAGPSQGLKIRGGRGS